MSETMSRLSDRGRGFINKHILKKRAAAPAQAAAPARPQAAAPALRSAAAPQAKGSAAAQPLELDRFGNDSPEEGLAAQALFPGQEGNDSPEEQDPGPQAAATGPGDPAPAIPPGYVTNAMPPGYLAQGETLGAGNFSFSSSESSSESSEEEPDFEEMYRQQRKPHAQVNTDQTPTGMKARMPGDEYEGEFNKAGWRRKSPEGAERTDMATRLYTEEEQRQNQLSMGADGRFRKPGADIGNQTLGYAMDATGRMVTFKETDNDIVTTTGDGKQVREETTRAMDILAGHSQLQPGERLEMAHHSTALGGDAVTDADGKAVLDATGKPVMRARPAASAGFVSFDYMGKIVQISNCSGHYKPTVDQLAQAIEHLLKQGAFFKDEVTDADGKQLRSRSKEMKLYQTTQQKLAESGRLATRVADLTASLQQAEANGDEPAQASLGATLGQISKELEGLRAQVEDAKSVLDKLGIGPSNRVRDVTAEFVDANKAMTGAAIRGATTSKMGAVNFMKTGGGNTRQAGLKAQVGEELKALNTFSGQDRARLAELKGKDGLTKQEAKELAELAQRHRVASSAFHSNKEAEARTEKIGEDAGPAPDVAAALERLGAGNDWESESSASESDEDSSTESESASR